MVRYQEWSLSLIVVAGLLVCGCAKQQQAGMTGTDSLLASNPQEAQSGDLTPQKAYESKTTTPGRAPSTRTATRASSRGLTLPSGTEVDVTLGTALSSETATVGSTWSGTVEQDVVVRDRTLIPTGSTATGTVTAVKPAKKGDRAMLDLALSSITADGHRYRVHGGTEAIIAGSTRARNLGAIAGGTAAGALVGKAVGGSNKGALIGGLLGGAASGGAVAASKGYQVVLKSGTRLVFTTSEAVAVRP
ncbi:MAG: hypothetical protein E6K78_07005 [Candidatus Eisenbacteria bacterium]|uniref:Glycine zipper 2TM domain-containing protein n=1 Tax=Eiseniibacteriota bacterium TaxID=2212470 RepID=A0A538TQE2_UNCEI|nr:MAG: hypothetical protein E6K78_07005 [Candidatus Eisenbacteria bacterium]